MKYTANYNLKKPEGTDTVNIDDLNANADIVDTSLNTLKNQVNSYGSNKADLVNGKVPTTQLPEMNFLSPTGDGKDVTVTFIEGTDADIASGETLATIFGKLLKKLKNSSATINNIINGTTKVGKAISADSAISATTAGSAGWTDKLGTPRKINGVTFDGTADITISATASGGNATTLNGKVEGALNVNNAVTANTATNSLAINGKSIWVGPIASKGTDANTIYFCY